MPEEKTEFAQRHPAHAITVVVNRKEVKFESRRVTGSEIKSTAITQGVPIQQDFNLFVRQHDGKLRQIGDSEEIELHEQDEFRAVSPDDTSEGVA